MFSVSKRAELGLYVLVELATEPTCQRSADDLAAALDVSTNHLAKVLQSLARAGWIAGTRGVGGGYQMTADPKELSMADVIELFEGATELSPGRMAGRGTERSGEVAGEIEAVMTEINEQAYYTLKSINIQLLAHPPARATARVA